MLTSTRSVVNALLLVLFLTMLVVEPNPLDISYFLCMFYFISKIK